MGDGIYVALSGALRESQTLDNVAENVANVSTPGFQRLRLAFREQLARATDGSPLRFAATSSTVVDATPGAMRETGRGLDVVLPAGSFLAVRGREGERYTRAGSLVVAPDGELRSRGGAPVLGEDGKIIKASPAAAEPTIAADGQVRQGDTVIGRLRVVKFDRPEALTREGAMLLSAPAAAGRPRPSAEPLAVGAVEESNTMREMTNLIQATRAFEAAQKTLEAFREIDRSAVSRVSSSHGA